jgi:hypothetical protein
MTKPIRGVSRRSFLRGLGATVALPFLPSLAPRGARAQVQTPVRFLAFFVPCGIHMPQWTPVRDGDLVVNTSMEPVAHLTNQLLVLSHLGNYAAEDQGDGAGGHARGTSTFLTCTHPRKAASAIYNGTSLDQLIAQNVGTETRLPSLELGAENKQNSGTCDSGYSCAYQRNISWASPTQPAPKEVNPRAVFDRLFGGEDPRLSEAQRARRRAYRLSVLDFVREDTAALQSRLGARDRVKLDDYLTSVREVERRIEKAAEVDQCDAGERPEGVPTDPEEHIKLMLDLMVLAMKCDVTRVGSFMLGEGGSNRTFPFLGINSGHHELSHHQNDPVKWQKLAQINTWEVEMLAYLLDAMRNVEEGDGTLLDNSIVMMGSEIADGNAHDNKSMPVLVAGRGGGQLRTGQHLVLPEETPIANFYMSIAQMCGVPVDSFGDDGTEALSDVFA